MLILYHGPEGACPRGRRNRGEDWHVLPALERGVVLATIRSDYPVRHAGMAPGSSIGKLTENVGLIMRTIHLFAAAAALLTLVSCSRDPMS